jgi:hypothetical protein
MYRECESRAKALKTGVFSPEFGAFYAYFYLWATEGDRRKKMGIS